MAITRDSVLKRIEEIQATSSDLVGTADEAARDGVITRDTFFMLLQLGNLMRMVALLVKARVRR